jgi:hypothetical protein
MCMLRPLYHQASRPAISNRVYTHSRPPPTPFAMHECREVVAWWVHLLHLIELPTTKLSEFSEEIAISVHHVRSRASHVARDVRMHVNLFRSLR